MSLSPIVITMWNINLQRSSIKLHVNTCKPQEHSRSCLWLSNSLYAWSYCGLCANEPRWDVWQGHLPFLTVDDQFFSSFISNFQVNLHAFSIRSHFESHWSIVSQWFSWLGWMGAMATILFSHVMSVKSGDSTTMFEIAWLFTFFESFLLLNQSDVDEYVHPSDKLERNMLTSSEFEVGPEHHESAWSWSLNVNPNTNPNTYWLHDKWMKWKISVLFFLCNVNIYSKSSIQSTTLNR